MGTQHIVLLFGYAPINEDKWYDSRQRAYEWQTDRTIVRYRQQLRYQLYKYMTSGVVVWLGRQRQQPVA